MLHLQAVCSRASDCVQHTAEAAGSNEQPEDRALSERRPAGFYGSVGKPSVLQCRDTRVIVMWHCHDFYALTHRNLKF
jgi:hypothetical protein